MMLEAKTRLVAETYREYTDRLKTTVEHFGEGAFSKVFKHPTLPNVVVKVVKADAAYLRYVKFCLAQRHNKWVPHIYKVIRLELDDHEPCHAVFLEMLRPALPKEIAKFFRPYAQFMTKHKATRMVRPGWEYMAENASDPELRPVAAFVAKNYATLDLQDANFMTRHGQLVFTDPVS